MKSEGQRIRLGSIAFINSLPVDFGVLSGAVAADVQMIQGAPTDLNQRLLEGKLDVSPVSALWYAEHSESFFLLPDLCISSESGVESVLLFSRKRFSDLNRGCVAMTGQGRTTPVLFEILCRMKYGIHITQTPLMTSPLTGIPGNSDAMLVIGDEALLARERLKNEDLFVIDLADEWKEWTKEPFVFAVWAVRRDFFATSPKEVFKVHTALVRSRSWGEENPSRILDAAFSRTHLPRETLPGYFDKLSYHFSEPMKQGLRLYWDYAVRLGILKNAVGMEFITPPVLQPVSS